jgi:hypothetical protein
MEACQADLYPQAPLESNTIPFGLSCGESLERLRSSNGLDGRQVSTRFCRGMMNAERHAASPEDGGFVRIPSKKIRGS